MDTPTFFGFVFPVLGTILVIFGMKYFCSARQLRRIVASEEGFRAIAEKATEVQAGVATALAAAQAELVAVRTRLGAIESMLREVG